MRAAAASGADAIEIGIPFSDPVMDGPVIQRASQAALDAGATPPAILDAAAGLDVEIPLAAMTYYNIVHHDGHRRFAGRLVAAGVAGCIVPDLPWRRPSRGRAPPTTLGSRRSCSPPRRPPTSASPELSPVPAGSSMQSVCSA